MSYRPPSTLYESAYGSEATYDITEEEDEGDSGDHVHLVNGAPGYHPSATMQMATSMPFERYQPGQSLEPIFTGETLQLEDEMPTPINPFSNAYHYPDQDYLPPSNASSSSSHDTSFPPSTMDHFQYDTEAYASGLNSRIGYGNANPRSRSPTPAVDDEDYQIVGDGSFHYTGQDTEKEGFFIGQHGPEDDAHSYHTTPSMTTDPETPAERLHFGPAPTGRILRRHRTKKRVKLTNGNLVLDLPVPPRLVLPRKGGQETTHTRYTMVTCDPDDFEKSGHFLRQNQLQRETEMFIVITMYNEDETLFCRTLYGVMQNISHLCTRKNSQTWGPEAWKKVVVCIVADGRKKIHPRVLDCLTLLGVYQEGDHLRGGLEKMNGFKPVEKSAVTAHLFEYTTSFGLDDKMKFRYPDKGVVPTQVLFCLKEKNQKKINSHRWFFNAFAPLLQPKVCILLDVGTRPGSKSLYHLWKTFDLNSNVGGACGEISVYKGRLWKALLNPLVAAQNFEYKISGILDKPTESLFGYISVLPGAFSAYRLIALQNDKNGVGPLASYFKGEVLHGSDTDIFTSNMYLAEDRILCFELVAKAGDNWVLKYVKNAVGETDVPDNLAEFISQRRRWLNGSFFAATYAIAHTGKVLRSGHSLARKALLMIETIYNIINLIFAWFSIGNFFIFFVVLTSSLEDNSFQLYGIQYVNTVVQYLLGSLIIACFLFSMGNKPKSAKWKYKSTALLFSILMIYMMFASVLCAVAAAKQGGYNNNIMLFSIIITYGLYGFSSVLAFDPWHMLTSFLPYLLLSPTYINILSIYAFSNLDDISWGTKQDEIEEIELGTIVQNHQSQVDVEVLTEADDYNQIYEKALSNLRNRTPVVKRKGGKSDAEKEQDAKDYYANVRTNVLLSWVLSNGVLLLGILGGGGAKGIFGDSVTRTRGYLVFILAATAMANIVRFLGSTLFLLWRFVTGSG